MAAGRFPNLAVLVALLGLTASCAPGLPAAYRNSGEVVEMVPARAAQEALAPVLPGPATHADLELAFPENGTIFSESPEAYLAGQLDAPWGVPGRVDAVVVIDTSHSTSRSAAAYEDDAVLRRVRGRRGPRPREASILEYELASARLLLEDVDPRNTRLGVVSFAGPPEGAPTRPAPNARTEVPLTRALDALEAGLQRIGRRGAAGRTDMAAGLDRAVDELIGRGRSRPERASAKVVVFFTDGTPTLPSRLPQENELAVIRAAERAAAHGVRVFSFAVGPEALDRPVAAVEMARRTGGVFTPVRDPRDLTEAVQSVRLARVDELTIRNVTVGSSARKVQLGPDGTFEALVPLEPGRNRIFVRAVVGNLTAEAERFVHYAPGSARPYVPPDLERRRLALTQGDRELDVDFLERLARQRKELEIRAFEQLEELGVPPDVAAPPPADAPAR